MFFVSVALAADLRTTLSAHDFSSCSSLGEANDALYVELVAATDPAILPSTVPMRAASCLVDLYAERPELATVLSPWMKDPERQGLALIVVGRIDTLPAPLALTLAQSAMTNPDTRARARFQSRLGASTRPEIRAVAGPE